MKMVKKPTEVTEAIYRVDCKRCGAVFECNDNELSIGYIKDKYPGHRVFTCPNCKQERLIISEALPQFEKGFIDAIIGEVSNDIS